MVHEASIAPIPIADLQHARPTRATSRRSHGSLLIAKITIEIDVRNDGSYGLHREHQRHLVAADARRLRASRCGASRATRATTAQRCGELGFTLRTVERVQAAFMTNPTNCGGGAADHDHLRRLVAEPRPAVDRGTTPQAAPTGCDKLAFAPSLTVSTDNSQPDTPASYNVDLKVPQNDDRSDLRRPMFRTCR